jgi:hypothetical protein
MPYAGMASKDAATGRAVAAVSILDGIAASSGQILCLVPATGDTASGCRWTEFDPKPTLDRCVEWEFRREALARTLGMRYKILDVSLDA